MSNIETYKRALAREKQARKLAEQIIEAKSLELFESNEKLKQINRSIEDEVKQRASEIQDLFDNMYDGYVRLDATGNVLKSNKAARIILGYPTDEEINGLSLADIVHEDDKESSAQYIQKLLKDGFYSGYVGRIYDKGRNIKYIEVNSNAIYNDQNEIIGSRDIIRDVTERKIAEEKLVESQKQLQAVFENKTIGIALFNKKGVFITINDTFQKQLGYEKDFYSTAVASRVIHAEDVKRYQDYIYQIYNGAIQEVQIENRYIRKNGGLFWANSNISGVYNEKNELVYYVLLVEDITSKKVAEEKLRLQEAKYRNIIANMNLGLLEVDTADKIQFANQSFLEMSGYELNELEGKVASTLFVDQAYLDEIEKKTKARAQGSSDAYELKIKNKQGGNKWWLISGAPRYDDSGKLVGSIGIHLDITEQKATQKQLTSSLQQLEIANKDLKDFAHVVSHDLKSPLRSISGLVQILQEDYKDKFDEEGTQIIEDVINRTEHMDELIGGILSYSSVQHKQDQLKHFESKEIIESLLKYIEIPVHITVQLAGDFPSLRMNPTHFQQVVQNFVTNAIKYNDKKHGFVSITAGEKEGFYTFEVKDNGNGINKRNQGKIFDMFQKFDAQGKSSSGIGLAIVKKIIELYRGKLSLQSEEGKGSIFTFFLPKT